MQFSRGPESIPERREVTVSAGVNRWNFKVVRWIDPAVTGWISGDHHIHAAGCAHYEKPTEGVHAPDMMKHVLGEDLKIGANLTWGPCFDYQKQFFTGKDSAVSRWPYLLRYDVEVSGFGSHEYIVDVTHSVPGPDSKPVPAVDFISTVDTPYPWELNIWYHTLNAGYRTRISGETDFPCIYGERVGLGRSYVKLPAKWSYEDWCEGIRAGRNYVGDGRSHLMEFNAGGISMGTGASELRLIGPQEVTFEINAAARLETTPREDIRGRRFSEQPFWHLERARIGQSRTVTVELIGNGIPVAQTTLLADGSVSKLTFRHPVTRSGWYAVRILPSSHTNPIFIEVGGLPVRERRSIQWCLDSVEQCWKQKEHGRLWGM